MADVYQREIDTRFGPVIEQVLKLANLQPGETVVTRGQLQLAPGTKVVVQTTEQNPPPNESKGTD